MRDVYRQTGFGLRFEWGLAGVGALAPDGGCVVVVDVLSFTTAVSVAVSRNIAVLPYRWNDTTAADFAAAHQATLAVGRSELNSESPWSLSPASIFRAPYTPRLVLPSPNGSTIAAAAGNTVVASSLRNGNAVAQWLLDAGFGTPQSPITVIAAGERWPTDNSLRPAIEDLLGAGQVLSTLVASGCRVSPEAHQAAIAYRRVDDLDYTLRQCSSGRELAADGFGSDVDMALEVDRDNVVPLLRESMFVDFAQNKLDIYRV